MRLQRLAAERFRNLAPLDLSLDAPFVVLWGPNGQGKTNALEAVHLLATLKPLRGRRIRDLIQWGHRDGGVAATIHHDGIAMPYRVDLASTGRTAWLDGQRVIDLHEYFAGIRAITFTPQDERIVSGEPGKRRNWLDRAAFTASPAHLDRVRAVRRVLDQKGALLRSGSADPMTLDVLDEQLATLASELVHRRQSILDELIGPVQALYDHIAGEPSAIDLELMTVARGADMTGRRQAVLDKLAVTRGRELQRQTTLVGPQLDDLSVRLDGQAARTFASRGQVRSLVLALKLAELTAARSRGQHPLFLIDDVSSELDRGRTARLVELLTDLDAQVVATTTDPAHITSLPAEDTLYVHVEQGHLELREPGSRSA